VLAFIVLIGLGTWQIQRKAWKEALIASLTAQLAAPPAALPPAKDWPSLDEAGEAYHRVRFSAQFDYAHEALVFATGTAFRPDVSGPGYWVFTPARLGDGNVVIVNRGFVPDGRQNENVRAAGNLPGSIDIVGAMRWPDARHWFTPNDDPAHNLWFSRDPQAIAAAKRLGAVAPFYVEQEAPLPPGGLPQPGRIVVALPDNHLQYAVTWYGLALVLVIMFASWAWSSSREAGGGRGSGSVGRSPSL
jgi:surfeit locus 1 family protein